MAAWRARALLNWTPCASLLSIPTADKFSPEPEQGLTRGPRCRQMVEALCRNLPLVKRCIETPRNPRPFDPEDVPGLGLSQRKRLCPHRLFPVRCRYRSRRLASFRLTPE